MQTTAPRPAADTAHDGARDFDFELGHWIVHNRRLRARLAGCDDWEIFDATASTHTILDGLGNLEELAEYRSRSPHGVRAHPTDEHFLPLFVALGAAGDGEAERVYDAIDSGVLAMDAYVFH